MKREGLIKQMAEEKRPWDLLIIGGGATGLGVAVDASSRGYRVLLVEQHDFAKATSSRSTKFGTWRGSLFATRRCIYGCGSVA